jgi:hypothetical protein
MPMPSLLILTVGTGTAGKHSDVAQGLANTIRLVRPRRFWLVPSISERSLPVADLIRESVADLDVFQPWSADAPYRPIANPDSLSDCRQSVREVIQAVRRQIRPGEKLIVNPTSGTKQMSAGATLAALDEEVDEIAFTVGQRADGVVKTGTEKIESFDLEAFLAERAVREAGRLFEAGAFDGAARLLESHTALPEAIQARDAALCLHHWQRLDFKAARAIAARSTAPALVATRSRLDALGRANELSLPVLAELLHSAAELRRWGAHEDSLARCYRALELAAKLRLAQHHGLRPPYALESLCEAAPSIESKLRALARDGHCSLGLLRSFEILDALDDAFARDYFADRRLRDLLSLRNETLAGHGTENVSLAQAGDAAHLLDTLLANHFPDLQPEQRLAATRPARLGA